MKFGDANTKYFHLMVNARKKKNHIVSLQTKNGLATSQRDKHSAIHDHFIQHINTYAPRQCKLNFSALGWQQRAQQHLDNSATEEELYRVIKGAPAEKAPGPDGFIGMFFSLCWSIIRADLYHAVNFFMSMNQQSLHLLNQAYVVLIPKISNPQRASNFRPIILTHSFAKLVSKLLANRLGSELHRIISYSQTVFIKRRCIHDSFM
jgi:hypothetical protein